LGDLFGGIGTSKWQFFILKIFFQKFPAVNDFKFFVIKTLDPDPDPH
jgi:hypothetical protein